MEALHPAPREQEELAHHPSPRKYVGIALILAIVTALEVAVYYIPAVEGILVPILLAMAVVKFIMVALYFMHLKFDSRVFRRFFLIGIVLAIVIFGVVLWMFFTAMNGPAPSIEA
ncbi:MAG TPA: cytochrome C oxidase subunit IV family protein [Actinomycetota bacterium]|nr:cytochrome C oxidase subunit IV family protein [Actinomycetota bacterium]